MAWSKADSDWFFKKVYGKGKSAEIKAEILSRFSPPTAAEVARWNRDRSTDIMDTIQAYAKRNGMPSSAASYILQIGWQNSKGQLKADGTTMAKKKRKSTKGLGMFALTAKSAGRRRWTKVSQGQNPMFRVPRGCAIVQSGEKKGKVRRGCKLTKNGAYCAELTKLPDNARIGPAKRRKDGRKRRRLVKCPDLT